MITAVTIVDDSGGSSLLVGTCRSRTENHRSSGVNRGSETEYVDLESFGAYRSDGSGWPVVRGGNSGGAVVVVKLVCSSSLAHHAMQSAYLEAQIKYDGDGSKVDIDSSTVGEVNVLQPSSVKLALAGLAQLKEAAALQIGVRAIRATKIVAAWGVLIGIFAGDGENVGDDSVARVWG
ncbi:unnamed protein product [Lactuca virosa]|uniref:RNase H type-1 domain-containing protein n=1 Tax=Lactuca virosa TaxID=75947 RepID=A0AAU9P7C1_9ASTR|nr:unnamed protein product [Lactuca virosa]